MEDRYRIIVVEDDDALRFALASWLEYEPQMDVVASVATGQEALDALAAAPCVDLLLVDFGLPDMSGAEVVRLAREQLPSVKVFLLTGHERADVSAQLDGVSLDGYMLKGQEPTQLMQELRALAAAKPA